MDGGAVIRHIGKSLGAGIVAILMVLMFLWAGEAFGDEVSIYATDIEDAYIHGGHMEYNYGVFSKICVKAYGATSLYHKRALIRPKNMLSYIPARAVFTSVMCSLKCVAYGGNTDVWALGLFKPWVEGTGWGAGDTWPGVTGNDWDADDWEWTTPFVECYGDDGSNNSVDNGVCGVDSRDRMETAEGPAATVTGLGWWTFPISNSLAQSWLNGIANGIILISDTVNTGVEFASTENATVEDRPRFWFEWECRLTTSPTIWFLMCPHGSPDTCMTVTTGNDLGSAENLTLKYDDNPALATPATIDNANGIERKHFEINGLLPGTRYWWVVVTTVGGAVRTDTVSFKTSQTPSWNCINGDTLTLFAVSDLQPGIGTREIDSLRRFVDTVWVQIRGTAVLDTPDYILNLGDVVPGATMANWDTTLKILTPFHVFAPILPCIGNHDGHTKGSTDPDGWTHHFNVPPNGNPDEPGWIGHQTWWLDIYRVRFISTMMAEAKCRSYWSQFRERRFDSQWQWFRDVITSMPPEIYHNISMAHVDMFPYPRLITEGAKSDGFRIYRYLDSPVYPPLYALYDAGGKCDYDTTAVDYWRSFVPHMKDAGGMLVQGHCWYSTFDLMDETIPNINCSGGDGLGGVGVNPGTGSWIMIYISPRETWVDYHKWSSPGWPDAAAVAAGYPHEGALNRVFTMWKQPYFKRFNGRLQEDRPQFNNGWRGFRSPAQGR